jgi:hypothetical protein
MTKSFIPKIATSNHLRQGDVIYFTGKGWTRHISEARVAATAEEAETLLAKAQDFPLETVGAVLTDVDLSTGVAAPVHFREVFRTKGPSNYFHGRQTETENNANQEDEAQYV